MCVGEGEEREGETMMGGIALSLTARTSGVSTGAAETEERARAAVTMAERERAKCMEASEKGFFCGDRVFCVDRVLC